MSWQCHGGRNRVFLYCRQSRVFLSITWVLHSSRQASVSTIGCPFLLVSTFGSVEFHEVRNEVWPFGAKSGRILQVTWEAAVNPKEIICNYGLDIILRLSYVVLRILNEQDCPVTSRHNDSQSKLSIRVFRGGALSNRNIPRLRQYLATLRSRSGVGSLTRARNACLWPVWLDSGRK